MSNSSDGRKQNYTYRDADPTTSSEQATPSSADPLKAVEKLLRANEPADMLAAEPQLMNRLQSVARQWGHLEFCSEPVCEQLVHAVLGSDSREKQGLLNSGIIRMVAATLCEDLTARARLAAFWEKLKKKAA
jgi:hypothetical protein